MSWLILITSLPSGSATPRMRIWRALKSSGAGVLRDGVYVLPERDGHESVLRQQQSRVEDAGGRAYLLRDQELERIRVAELFDRSEDYAGWGGRLTALKDGLDAMDEPAARRLNAQLARELENIVRIDFFPKTRLRSGRHWNPDAAKQALKDLGGAIDDRFSPGEPSAGSETIPSYAPGSFNGRLWATRQRLWVDRVASAWLIKRFIDPQATFLWFARQRDVPADAVGFDYDGAMFSHVNDLVTFETLLRGFGLEQDPVLMNIGELVHYLDVGGIPPPDASGLVAVLAGARSANKGDDDFFEAAGMILDSLYAGYQSEAHHGR